MVDNTSVLEFIVNNLHDIRVLLLGLLATFTVFNVAIILGIRMVLKELRQIKELLSKDN